MYTINQIIAAFAFGWLTCAVSIILGGWIEKVESRSKRRRSGRER